MAKLENVKTLDMVNGEITKVEYGGEVYVKVDGLAEKGDLALVNKWVVDTTAGDYYKVMMTSNHVVNEFRYYDDVDDAHHSFMSDNFTFFRKQSAPSLNERVSVLESKVATIEKKSVAAETIEERISHNGAEYKLVDRKAQAGDVVVFLSHEGNDYLSNGKPYGPVSVHMTVVDNDGDDCLGVYASDHNRTTDTVKVYEPVAKELPLNVGDYAKVIQKGHGQYGKIVKLAHYDSPNLPFESIKLDGTKGDAFAHTHLVRATDEEVAEAKAQAEKAAIEAKWASIGRKPNEFRKGDIVRLTQDTGANEKGEIVTLAEDDADYYYDEEGDVYGCDASWVELITPVESRFDHA